MNSRKTPFRVLCLLILLAISLMMLGGGGWFFLHRTSEQYLNVFRREFAMLTVLRDITRDSNATRRQVYVVLNTPLDERAAGVARFRELSMQNDDNFSRFSILEKGVALIEFENLREARARYLQVVDSALSGHRGSTEQVDDLFAAYVDRQDALAAKLQDAVFTKQIQLERQAIYLGYFFLMVAAWPLIVASMIILYLFLHTLTFFAGAFSKGRV